MNCDGIGEPGNLVPRHQPSDDQRVITTSGNAVSRMPIPSGRHLLLQIGNSSSHFIAQPKMPLASSEYEYLFSKQK